MSVAETQQPAKLLGNYFSKNALTRSFAVLQFCRLDIKVSRIGKPYN